MRELRLTQAFACARLFMVLAFGILITLSAATKATAQCTPTEGTIEGIVYLDEVSDGVFTNQDIGLSNVMVTAYDEKGISLGFGLTNDKGYYTIEDLPDDIKVQVLFNYSPNLVSSILGVDNASDVQYATVPSCNVSLGLIDADANCSSNPDMVATCFALGAADGENKNVETIIGLEHNFTLNSPVVVYATMQETGSVWGTAWKSTTQEIFSASFIKQNVGLKDGPGAVYRTKTNGGQNTTEMFVDLADVGVNVAKLLVTDPMDCNYGAQVGKAALGAIVVSPDEQWLYTVNLSDNTLVKFSSTNPTTATTTVTPIPNPGCTNGDARAFALKFFGDDLYIGVTCTAETSYGSNTLTPAQLEQESSANVYKFNTGSKNFDLEFSTNYIKGYWTDNNPASSNTTHWLTDIDFTDEGNMLIALTDRVGHRFCHESFLLNDQKPDLLLVYKNNGNWTLENNGTAGSLVGTGVDNNQGPGGGEFFGDDFWITDPAYHSEISLGSIVVLPGTGSVVSMVYDPFVAPYAGGLHRYNTSNGSKIGTKQLYARDVTQYLGKATGFGEVVLKCGVKPIEIGNYVWIDSNNDGIQNADENGFGGLPLQLLDNDCNIIGSTVTDSRGYYTFNMSNVDRNLDGVFDGLMPNADYFIKVGEKIDDSGTFYTINGAQYLVCNGSSGSEKTDCDISIIEGTCNNEPLVRVNTGDFGMNDYSFDIGLYAPSVLDIALRKELLSNNMATYGSLVDFKITVFNQGDKMVKSVTITDYLNDAYSFSEDDNPGWSISEDMITYKHTGDIAPLGQEVFYLRLQVNDFALANELHNFAEISGASDFSGPVQGDLDSMFDQIKDNDNGGAYDTNTDNEIDDSGIIDEDDHDVAAPNVFDLALDIEDKAESRIYRAGDRVDFVITVYNEGLLDAESFGLINYIPEGLEFLEAEDEAWLLDGSQLLFNETKGLVAGAKNTYCISFTIKNNVGRLEQLINIVEVSGATVKGGYPSIDFDSAPDSIKDNDSGDSGSSVAEDSESAEDDHDIVIVNLRYVDLALRKTAISNAAIEGEEAIFKIEIINQGTETVGGFEVVDFFPSELIFSDQNWTATGNKAYRTVTIPEGLKQGESYPLTIKFQVREGTDLKPIINYAEIFKVYSMDNEDVSSFDVDSTPDETKDNDNGGEVNSAFDDFIEGSKDDDEDDHDPAQMVFINGSITSACICTDPAAGFFTNEVTITAEDGQEWYVDQALGAFSTSSTEGNLVQLESGSMGANNQLTLVEVDGVEDNYVINVYSLDGLSWQLTLRNEQDNEVFIQGIDCNNSFIVVSGEAAVCTATTEVYTVTNPTAGDVYTFTLPPGSGTLTTLSNTSAEVDWSVNGGPFLLSVSNTGANSECQSPTIVGGQGVTVGSSNGPLSCVGHTNVSLNGDCELLVKPRTISSQPLDPSIPYTVMLTLPNGTVVPNNTLTSDHVGLLVEAKLIEGCGNNVCWGTITVEDKLGPVFNCEDTEVFCFNVDEYGGPLALDACEGPVAVEYTTSDTELLLTDPDYTRRITRTYIAQDSKGNQAEPCEIVILVKRIKFEDIDWPDDITGSDALICTDLDDTGVPSLEVSGVPTMFGYPLLPSEHNACDFTVSYEDRISTHVGCYTSVMREYKVVYCECLTGAAFPNYVVDSYTQVIEINDNNDPTFEPIEDITLEAEKNSCVGTATILYPTGLTDQCSDIRNIDLQWTPVGEGLPGFEGNVTFPYQIEDLPIGESLVTYRAYDDCGNSSTASINVTVNGNFGPSANCKEVTVGLGADGFAYLPALSINDGSEAVCGNIESYQVRRLDDGAECYADPVSGDNVPTTEFGDRVFFCCEDAGDTIMVALQVTDNYDNVNICMSMVIVQDPFQPTVTAPDDETIDCELFTTQELEDLNDSDITNNIDLSAYGFAVIADECGSTDTIITSFQQTADCNTGTITREFIAMDSNGQSSDIQTITITKTPLLDSDISQFEILDTNICNLDLLEPNMLPIPFNTPVINKSSCDQTTAHVVDEDVFVFPYNTNGVNDYCFKIIRQWEITSLCDLDMDGNPLRFYRTQVIRIVNLDAPVIVDAPLEIITQCVEVDSTTAEVEVIVTAMDDCTISNNLEWSYTLTNTTSNTIIVSVPYAHNYGNVIDVSGTYEIGDYKLEFTFRDRCGNETTGEQLFYIGGEIGGECNVVEECVMPLIDIDINRNTCNVDLNEDIDILISGVPEVLEDCECSVIDTLVTDMFINGVGVMDCDSIRRTVTLTFECPTGPTRTVDRSHTLILYNTNAPVLVLPDTPDTVDITAGCEALVNIDLATSIDGCSTGVEIINSYNDGGANASGIYPVGNTTVIYAVSNLCDSTMVDSIVVSVRDAIAPVCNTQDITVSLDGVDDIVVISPEQINAGSMDECSDSLRFTVFPNTFDCSDRGDTIVTLTVTDISGNESSCTANVFVEDNGPLICNTQDVTVFLDDDGMVEIFADDINNGSTFGCNRTNFLSINVLEGDLDCSNIGIENELFLEFVYPSNGVNVVDNTTCSATVTVRDTIAPECNVQDITVDVFNAFGETIDPADFDNINTPSEDNCGGDITFEASQITFNCDDLELPMPIPVDITVSDEYGNESTCQANVTLVDMITPTCATKDTVLYQNSQGEVSITAIEVDNGSSLGCGINQTYSLAIGEYLCNDQGEEGVEDTLFVISGMDTLVCPFVITVLDTFPPIIGMACPDPVTVSCEDFTGNLDNYGNTVEIMGSIVDACGIDSVRVVELVEEANTCGVGTYTRTFVAWDRAGNTDTCTQVVTVELGENALTEDDLIFPEDTIRFGDCSAFDLDDLDSMIGIDSMAASCFDVTIMFSDSLINVDMPCNDTITRTYTIIDSCQYINDDGPGVFEFVQTIIVDDTTAPGITGPEDLTVTIQDTTICVASLDLSGFEVTNCDENFTLTTTIDTNGVLFMEIPNSADASGDYEIGEYEITLTATDNCGNDSNYVYNVTVLDTTYFYLTCLKLQPPMEADTSVDVLARDLVDTLEVFNCAGIFDIDLAYSPNDINDTIRSFGCEAVSQPIGVEIFLYIDGVPVDFCRGDVQLRDPTDLCMDGLVGSVIGTVFTANNDPVSDVHIDLDGSNQSIMTDENGYYAFPDMTGGDAYQVIPTKDDNPTNGVTTLDLILIQRHILGIANLESPYDLIAADIDASGSLSGIDIIQLRKLILGIYNDFPDNTSWRMIDRSFEFWDPSNAYEEAFPETYDIDALVSTMKADFIGVKTGDVNGTVDVNGLSNTTSDTRSDKIWYLKATDKVVEAGESITFDVVISEEVNLQGFQLALATDKVSDISLSSTNISFSEDNYSIDRMGVINMSWNTVYEKELSKGASILEVTIVPAVDGKLSEMISIYEGDMESQTYSGNEISHTRAEILWDSAKSEFALYQNTPNPWAESTNISFMIPTDGNVIINVRSVNGQLIKSLEGYYESGIHSIKLSNEDLLESGVYYYEMRYDDQTIVEKMILMR